MFQLSTQSQAVPVPHFSHLSLTFPHGIEQGNPFFFNPTKKWMPLKPFGSPSLIPKTQQLERAGTQRPKPTNNPRFSCFFSFFPSTARLFPGCGAAPGSVSRLLASPPPPPPIPCQDLHTKDACAAPSPPIPRLFPAFFPAGFPQGGLSLLVVTQIPVM